MINNKNSEKVSLKGKTKNVLKTVGMVAFILSMYINPVFATDAGAGVEEFNKVILFIAGWVNKLGMVVAFFGAIQLALGFKNDDADAKVRGLKTLISGFLVFAISLEATVSSLFGIS